MPRDITLKKAERYIAFFRAKYRDIKY